jgi:hypothetical protein
MIAKLFNYNSLLTRSVVIGLHLPTRELVSVPRGPREMSSKPRTLRLGLTLGFLLTCVGLGSPVALPAATESSLSGTYNCVTLEVAGKIKPCRAPSLELKADGSFRLLSESGNYEIVGGRWLVLSTSSKRHGRARLDGSKKIVFEFISHGKKSRITYRKKFQRQSGWLAI